MHSMLTNYHQDGNHAESQGVDFHCNTKIKGEKRKGEHLK